MKKGAIAYRIETPRFVLRCWEPTDAAGLKAAVDGSLDHLREWMPWAKDEPTPYDGVVDRLRRFRSLFDGDTDYIYAAFTPDESCVIGGSGLHKRGAADELEIGYWINVDFNKQGYATEISRVLTHAGFLINGANRIEIRCAKMNEASANIPKKLGYVHEASLRDVAVPVDGERSETMVWGLFAEEFEPSEQPIPFKAYGADGQLLLDHGL